MSTVSMPHRGRARPFSLCSAVAAFGSAVMLISAGPAAARLPDANAGAWAGYNEYGYAARPAARTAAKGKRNNAARLGRSARRSVSSARPMRRKARGYAAATTSASASSFDASPYAKSLTGGGVRWAASSSCLNGSLASVVSSVASTFGAVTVNSTCRSRARNARVGGARHSHHLSGNAVDFRVHGANAGAVLAYLKSSGAGGIKHYGGGLFHVDTGARRTW